MALAPIISPALPNAGNTQAGGAVKPQSPTSMFEDLLDNAVRNTNQSEADVQAEALKIASGQSDSLHTLAINSAKAELALSALVQVRNKALDAYNEVMRITL